MPHYNMAQLRVKDFFLSSHGCLINLLQCSIRSSFWLHFPSYSLKFQALRHSKWTIHKEVLIISGLIKYIPWLKLEMTWTKSNQSQNFFFSNILSYLSTTAMLMREINGHQRGIHQPVKFKWWPTSIFSQKYPYIIKRKGYEKLLIKWSPKWKCRDLFSNSLN